jgi:GH24 family phage-related lysozyme (muramidase)
MPSLESLLRQREGCRNDVYLDSRKKPTVGIGHLVTSADKLKVGDKIDNARVSAFFQKDSAIALSAARSQASKAGITDSNFIIYLASVNFQLGPAWYKKFAKTWDLIMKKHYKDAALEAQKSAWYSQTPVRVKDFQLALRKLPEKPSVTGAVKGAK